MTHKADCATTIREALKSDSVRFYTEDEAVASLDELVAERDRYKTALEEIRDAMPPPPRDDAAWGDLAMHLKLRAEEAVPLSHNGSSTTEGSA
jgi:hypothetical protein